jgi:hypothetical protein
VVPDSSLHDQQETAAVDVFYLYPTTYTGKRGQRDWNGDVWDSALSVRTDKLAIRNQASIFNASCKVYAPRYRQAHLECFFTRRKKKDAEQALQLAYKDVRAAFEYYLKNYNQGRPLVIAAHSQGSMHASHLIREFYEDHHTMPDLVAAYLLGMPVEKEFFATIQPCASPDDIHCFCSWRTVHKKYRPNRYYPTGSKYAVINPLTWNNNTSIAPREMHQGAVLRKFYDGLYPNLIDVWVDNGLLRVSKPKIPGAPFLPIRNFHVADFNFFYVNVRENVADRIDAYFKIKGKE